MGALKAMHPLLREGLTLFNRRQYFACHERLEELWREGKGEEQKFYEGLIQVATALHLRFYRGGHRGTINLLNRALLCLEDYRPHFQGINVELFCRELEAYLEELRNRKKVGFFERFRVPQIRLV